MSGNKTPRTPLEFLIQDSNRFLSGLSLGTITISSNKGTTSSVTSVPSSASSVQLLASDPLRVEAIIYNDSTEKLYIKLGVTATTSDYTIVLDADESLVVDRYTGIVHGVWASVNGSAKITNVTP